MNLPVWLAQLAEKFWDAAGAAEPFPRSLESPLMAARMLSLVRVPRLSVSSLRDWLTKVGIRHSLDVADRPLRACLVAYDGVGFAFIDSADSEDERRFSLAHELAHFLRDYLAPREAAKRRIGLTALQVLDGRRKATADERVRAWCSQTDLGVHVHLMERGTIHLSVREAEDGADRLAYELLAPATDVTERVQDAAAAVEILTNFYRLPSLQAEHYAKLLFPAARMDPLLARLRLAPSEARS